MTLSEFTIKITLHLFYPSGVSVWFLNISNLYMQISSFLKKPIFFLLAFGFTTFVFSQTTTSVKEILVNTPVADLHRVFRTPISSKGLEFDESIMVLNNSVVQMTGFMVKTDEPEIGEFLLSIRPVELNRHADGDANDLPPSTVSVLLDPSQANLTVPYSQGLHTFKGVLSLGRVESSSNSVSWIRLQLPVLNN